MDILYVSSRGFVHDVGITKQRRIGRCKDSNIQSRTFNGELLVETSTLPSGFNASSSGFHSTSPWTVLEKRPIVSTLTLRVRPRPAGSSTSGSGETVAANSDVRNFNSPSNDGCKCTAAGEFDVCAPSVSNPSGAWSKKLTSSGELEV